MRSLDVVYPLKPGALHHELRYSLRSLVNLPHRNVWLVGPLPSWAENVAHIPITRPEPRKHRGAAVAIDAACRCGAISEDFILMNDDFFVLQPIEELPPFHCGPLAAAIERYRGGDTYRQGMVRTFELLRSLGIREPLCYELHVPAIMNRKLKLALSARYRHPLGYHLRTLYYNTYGIEGQYMEDVKLYRIGERIDPAIPFLSTADTFARSQAFHDLMQQRFPEPWYYDGMKRYTYKNMRTGKRVQSDTPLKDKNLVLVAQIRDGQIKGNNIMQK